MSEQTCGTCKWRFTRIEGLACDRPEEWRVQPHTLSHIEYCVKSIPLHKVSLNHPACAIYAQKGQADE